MNNEEKLWGIDLGGTKIEGVIMHSIDDINPLARMRVPTEQEKGYEHILLQIKKVVDEMSQQSGGLRPKAVGIGAPGVPDPSSQTMKNCNTTCLIGKPMKHDLEKILQAEVHIANDANCFALAETHWGVAKEKYPEARMVFGVIMGTGVGGGIVIDGKVWNGHHGIAGEWGHNFLDESGGKCYCGRIGCVETVVSGPALERYYAKLSGTKMKLKDIATIRNNDKAAAETIDRLHYFFGKALSVVTNLLDPDVIIIGGGVGNIDSIYTEGVESLRHFIFNNGVDVKILKPSLGDSAGVFGAAALVRPNL
jgi:predicted NBD/HSP70 family sugar kinase